MADDIPLAGVLGDPIAHSKSPRLFAYWLRRYGLKGHYVPMRLKAATFEDAVRALPKLGFVGANVTLPHKERALALADRATDRATLIGAANTLTFRQDGSILADNTDGYGFTSNILSRYPHWDPAKGSALVLGAGGAARAIVAALVERRVPRIILCNRTRRRADDLAAIFGSRVEVADWIQAGNLVEDAATIVNTTSLGMTGQGELRIPLDGLRPGTLVNDIVYTPLETRLLREAHEAGAHVVDGLGMLLHQAVPGFERWFGVRPTIDQDTRDIVLA
ncbi:MAG: shikimate dehydrogenase [Shimia sp.]